MPVLPVRISAIASIALLTIASGPLDAQVASPTTSQWIASLGMNPPTISEHFNLEENFVASLGRQWARSGSGLGFRAQLSVGAEPSLMTRLTSGECGDCSLRRSRRFAELSGAAVYTFRRDKSFRPYVLGGPALYGVRTSYKANGLIIGGPTADNPYTTRAWSLGATVGVGAGLRLFGKEFLIEQRVMSVGGRQGFVAYPLSIGIKF